VIHAAARRPAGVGAGPTTLPHYRMVLHRCGFPDGS